MSSSLTSVYGFFIGPDVMYLQVTDGQLNQISELMWVASMRRYTIAQPAMDYGILRATEDT